ncbi:hypothetical protein B7494_g1863 [Chlorociboria aeruginascens]|nr:hypothetical protein B7494_g1863 [Chlorociboria aeruginascens]
MAVREFPSALCRLATRPTRPAVTSTISRSCRRYASEEATSKQEVSSDLRELESSSSISSVGFSPLGVEGYDPVKRAQGRRRELPPSRFQYRPPKYYRGPLHPHQPPPKSDPSSREFVPGPFSYTRLEQTYQSTIAPDLMVMTYAHKPPGTPKPERAPRLREWDDSSPYHKGRPKRGPRGPGSVLRLIERDINWRNIPKIEAITVHSFIKGAIESSAHLHVGGMMLQAITGVRPVVHRARQSVQQFGIRTNMAISLTCEMRGDQAYDFLDKCVNLVWPRMKDWNGVEGSTGDGSGNLGFGFDREGAILFPEVEVNYDMYPPKMIPGFHVTVKTTANSDRHARLLLSAMGVPFHGKLVDW